ncbi:uncharacterized protein LOC104900653 [Beta vulgaris subsp. vulgaris]|uniref:uncharacterized protein LOC104900653 n=1 Tax=Beta vulgaris subsp. vulgaris TaxID=3555 RepID=UPI00203672CB|nr:uncharacterized protein LOC104900653 [Beta vulgaris subsp. vulgaris]
MASMSMMNNTICKVSKPGFPTQVSSLYPRQVSRVCFTSASKFHKNQFAGEDARLTRRIRQAPLAYENDEEAKQVGKTYADIKQKGNDTIDSITEGVETATQKAQEDMSKATDTFNKTNETVKDKVTEGAERVGDTLSNAKESTDKTTAWAADQAKEGAERVGETLSDAKKSSDDTAAWTVDQAKEGAGKVGETMKSVNETVNESVKGAWESAVDATQKMKETVVGNEDK